MNSYVATKQIGLVLIWISLLHIAAILRELNLLKLPFSCE